MILHDLTVFQSMLLSEMKRGVWYYVYWNQGTGGAKLPDWFYRDQTQPLATLRPMIEAAAIKGRLVDGFPQVMRVHES